MYVHVNEVMHFYASTRTLFIRTVSWEMWKSGYKTASHKDWTARLILVSTLVRCGLKKLCNQCKMQLKRQAALSYLWRKVGSVITETVRNIFLFSIYLEWNLKLCLMQSVQLHCLISKVLYQKVSPTFCATKHSFRHEQAMVACLFWPICIGPHGSVR